MPWPVSDPVPFREKPSRAAMPVVVEQVGIETLRSALAAIPNSGDDELDYDAWRDIIFGIHAETGGDDVGLALAHEFSAKSTKYDAEFIDNRIWPYIKDKADGISGRTVLAKAREQGWREDITGFFEVISVEDADGELVEDRGLVWLKRDLCVDHLKRVMVGELVDKVGPAGVDELCHQPIDHRIDYGLAPFGNNLRQEGLLENLAVAGVIRRIHDGNGFAKRLTQAWHESLAIGEDFGVGQDMHYRIVTQHHDLRQIAVLDVLHIGKL
jgi:hypothetical protein